MRDARLSEDGGKGDIMQIGHLSVTQINMYNRCGIQYWFRYCEGVRKPPGGALTLGAAFHGGIAVNYRQKVESGQDMPIADVLDAFSTDFDNRSVDTEWRGDSAPEVKDTGILLLKEYQRVVAPYTQPIEVEQQFNMTFKNKGWTFTGIIDLIDNQDTIIETKTTGRKPSNPRPEHLLQIHAYTKGYQTKEAKGVTGARIDYVVKRKEPVVVSFTPTVTESDMTFFLRLMTRVAHGIENEVWVPSRGHNLCSRKWCGYWNECEKLMGGRVRD